MTLTHFTPELRLGDIANIGGFKMQGASVEDFAGFNFGWGDFNGDGLSDLLVCADGYDGGGYLAGGAFVIYGKNGGISPFIDFANLSPSDGFVIQGEFAYDLASRMLSSAGDVNGDGIEDMFIGAFKNDEGAFDSGAAYIIYGKADPVLGPIDLYDLQPDVGIKILGEESEDYASFWVAAAGDVNGDGRPDLIMGAPQNDAGGSNAGAAYVIFGRDGNYAGKIDLAALDPATGFKITGAAAGDVTGYAVSGADFNGDGLSDLIIGAPQDGTGAGRAYVVYGRPDIGALDLAQLTPQQGFVIQSEAFGDLTGFNVARAGDVNGDGVEDMIVGATKQDAGGVNSGAAYVIFGQTDGFGATLDLTTLDGTNGFKLIGAAAGDETGVCVATAGDVNGDGYDDILVGAQFSSITGTISGVAYLLFGRADGFAPTINLGQLSPSDGIRIRGEGAGETTGRAVSAAGDMNGDGYDDIAIGSPWNNNAGFKSGLAYVIYGRPDNHAPVALNTHVTGVEDTAYVFGVADFGLSDVDGDALLEVRIATLPTHGALMLRGENGAPDRAVTAGETLSATVIAAGRLYLTAEPDVSGAQYASFTFGVRDDGGIVGTGEDSSANLATLSVALTADSSDTDLIYGTSGNDTLVGTRADASLFGFAGDDLYVVNASGQRAVELPGEGYDTVRTSVDYALTAGQEIEQLEAANRAGTNFLRLTGNEYANYLRGNDGVNSLYGAGGGDTLEGFGGDDSYLVSTSADRIIEVAGGGNDTVYALGDYVLTAGAAIETLLAYDRAVGTAQNLTGNEFDNIILGTQGANLIVGGGGRDTMYGYRGDDTYMVDSADDLPIELYGEGYDTIVTTVSYTIPQGMEFEVLRTIDPTATTAINLTGNKIGNIIIGNAGANVIDGLGGGDDMSGLAGNDTYVVRHVNDRVREAIGGGSDTVRAVVSHTLAADAEIERFEAFDPAATGALNLTGNAFASTMVGSAGANILDGGGGGDDMSGLGGNDTYIVRHANDRVREGVGGGVDTVRTLVDHSLAEGAEVERLEAFDPTATTALRLTGNAFANTIVGNAGSNVLDGGAGADVLQGLGGADVYMIKDARNRIVERVGDGYDTVYTLTGYALEAGSEVEVLTVYDRATTSALQLSGNEFANLIYGNAGNNLIDGGGGADTLYGLAGDDTYIVRNAEVSIVEAAGGGYDTVRTLVSYTLGRDAQVEALTAFDATSTVGLRLTGNTFANMISGTAGNDSLSGILGADTLYGLRGNDSYLVQDVRAVVFEGQGEGNDTVYTTVGYSLAAGSEVEVLTAYDRATVNALDLAGNEFANTIYGNAGANRIDGGSGADVLYGLGGADTFVFSTPPTPGNVDRIADFTSGIDRIELAGDIFTDIAAGSGWFVAGTQAQDADDRILYDQASGALFYDADGSGAGLAVQFASLAPRTTLVASDFVIL